MARRVRRRNPLAVLVLAACWCWHPAEAAAQFEPGDSDPPLSHLWRSPPLDSADIRAFALIAGLTPDQRSAVADLHAAFIMRFNAAEKKFSLYLSLVTPGPAESWHDAEHQEFIQEAERARDAHGDRLLASFVKDVAAVLTDAQSESLDLLESLRLRLDSDSSHPAYARLDADLTRIIASSMRDLTVSPELRQAVVKYARERRSALPDPRTAPKANYFAIKEDPTLTEGEKCARLREGYIAGLRRSERLRSLNDALLRMLRYLIPADRLLDIEESYFESADISGSFRDRRNWKQLALLADLTAEQRDRLSELRARLRAAIVGSARRMWDALVRTPPEDLLDECGDFPRHLWEERWRTTEARSQELLNGLRLILTTAQIDRVGLSLVVRPPVVPKFDDLDFPVPRPEPGPEGEPDGYFVDLRVGLHVTPEDISWLIRLAEPDADVADAARTLHADYSASMRRAAMQQAGFSRDINRARVAGLLTSEDCKPLWHQVYAGIALYREQARTSLLRDLHSLLTAENEHTWSRFERRIRYRTYNGSAGAFLEPLGLIDIPTVLQLIRPAEDEGDSLDTLLLRYEAEADGVVQRVLEISERLRISFEARVKAGGVDDAAWELMRDQYRRMDEEASALRVLNLEYADRIAARLSGFQRLQFEELAYSAAAREATTATRSSDVQEYSPSALLEVLTLQPDITEDQRASARAVALESLPALIERNRVLVELLVAAESVKTEEKWSARHTTIITEAGWSRHWLLRDIAKRMVRVLPGAQSAALPEPYRRLLRPVDVPIPDFDDD